MEKLKNNKIVYNIGSIASILYYDVLIDGYAYMKHLLRLFHIMKKTNNARLRFWKNKYRGKRCFIVATGPSLTLEDLNLLKNEICFGVNSVVKLFSRTEWRPTFYGIQDAGVYKNLEGIINQERMETVFISETLSKQFNVKEEYIKFNHFSCFHRSHREMMPKIVGFSNDVEEIVYDGYSVTYSMLQIACYMGFDEIYLLGCDCNYPINGKQHIIESGHVDNKSAIIGKYMIYAYKKALPYLKKKNIKVYNCTRGGMLNVFERKSLEDITSVR